MAFDTLPPALSEVAEKTLEWCRPRYGANGVKIEQQISADLNWRPTFFLKPSRALIYAVEISEVLYPEVLKGAALDIRSCDIPIVVAVACPLSEFIADKRQATVNKLKADGFALITVDEDGTTTQQFSASPLAQHISEKELDQELKLLPLKLKGPFRSAYATYQNNVGQGLQEAGQIIEAMIECLAKRAEGKGWVTGISKLSAATIIDRLYVLEDRNHSLDFTQSRAALGKARAFVKHFRNTASHPATNAAEHSKRIRKCRAGFLEAVQTSVGLLEIFQDKSFRIVLHV